MSGRKGAGKNTLSAFMLKWHARSHKCRVNWSESRGGMECSFADNLKEFCINTLGLDRNQCYGTDDQKNSPTKYDWQDAPKFLQWKFGDEGAQKSVALGRSQNDLMMLYHKLMLHNDQRSPVYKTGKMTGREIMQVFGTDLVRQSFGNVWADATIRRIKAEGKSLSVITDNRFPNEIKSVLDQPRGYIIRLTRTPFGTAEAHPSESALDDFDWTANKCYVLDNKDLSIEEQNEAVVPILCNIFNQE